MTFNSDIEKTEKEIAVLQKKLELLKEIEAHKSQPKMKFLFDGKFEVVSYNNERYYRLEFDDKSHGWYKRKDYLDAIVLNEITDCETRRLLEGLWFNEVKRGKYDEQPTNWEPKKQTPEEVSEGLRSAMRQAKEEGVFDTPKKETLYDIILDWWDGDNEPTCEELVNRISGWFPEPFQSYGQYQEGWNDCIENLRLKLK